MFKKIINVSEKVLLILLIVAYFIYTFLNIGYNRLTPQTDQILQYIGLSLVVLLAIITPLKRMSNIVLFLIILTFLGVFLNLLTAIDLFNFTFMNLNVITFIYLVIFIKGLIIIKKNVKIKWMLTIATLITWVYFGFFSLYLMKPTLMSSGLYNFSYIIFFIVSLALIFGLPNSDLPEWEKEHRQLFLKLIMPVWILIFFISSLNVFIPIEKFRDKIAPELKDKWGMKDYLLIQ